jgi:hypothetical protein
MVSPYSVELLFSRPGRMVEESIAERDSPSGEALPSVHRVEGAAEAPE